MRKDRKYIVRHPGLKMGRSFFFVRHGWSVANAEGIIASRLTDWRPDLGLTDGGKKEVEFSAREFYELHKAVHLILYLLLFNAQRKLPKSLEEY